MAYLAVSQLMGDPTWQNRARACATEQAGIYKDDQRASWSATAEAVLRDEAAVVYAFVRLNAAGPGIGDKADNGDGTIDQAKVSDADLLSLTQANWPVVAGLYFTEDGTPIP
jgi:hypothetical protein